MPPDTLINIDRTRLYHLLGDLPQRDYKLTSKTISEEDRGSFYLEKLILDLNGHEPVPAYFLRPKHIKGPAPAILYNHYHSGLYQLGKDEVLTAKPEENLSSYAEDLTKQGYCVLCIDAWGFGERAIRTESEIFKSMLWRGQVLWGMMVYDSLRAIDYLTSRNEVDAKRIGTLGMSMGSTMAWWLAALDERIKVCIDICCLTDYQELEKNGGLDEHGIYYYVPSLLKHFTAADINSLISPRPHLSLAGNLDNLTPSKGLDIIDAHLKLVYKDKGVPDHWKLLRYNVGHIETQDMRNEALNFLQKHI